MCIYAHTYIYVYVHIYIYTHNEGECVKVQFNFHSEHFGSIVYYRELLACLTRQIKGLMEDIERREEWRRNSQEEILGKLNSINSENENIRLENKKLKVR